MAATPAGLPAQQRHERATLQPVRLIGRIGAKRIQECRCKIDRLYQLVADRTARRIGVRVIDDKRDFHRRLVEELFLTQPVVTEIIAVV